MDAVAIAVKELILSNEKLPPLVNVVHPRPVPWRSIFDSVNSNLSTRALNIVPLHEWLQNLEDASQRGTQEDLERFVRKLSCLV